MNEPPGSSVVSPSPVWSLVGRGSQAEKETDWGREKAVGAGTSASPPLAFSFVSIFLEMYFTFIYLFSLLSPRFGVISLSFSLLSLLLSPPPNNAYAS